MIEDFRDHLHAIINIARELQDLSSSEDQLTLLETIENHAYELLENGLRWLEEIEGDYNSIPDAVDTMSDEFRTPITSIRSYSQVMLLEDLSEEERALLDEMKARADEMWGWVTHQ